MSVGMHEDAAFYVEGAGDLLHTYEGCAGGVRLQTAHNCDRIKVPKFTVARVRAPAWGLRKLRIASEGTRHF